jgi:hypothetical protein
MKNRSSTPFRRLSWWLSLSLALSLGSTGCRSFLAGQAMKTYSVSIKPTDGLPAPNRYQEDFLYLKAFGEEVVPLLDHYFPPDKRVAMEQEILQNLGRPDCSYETFLFSIRSYLAAFNNSHARVIYNPREIRFSSIYPFRIHYLSNDVYVVDVAREYDRSLIGQRITAINGHPISDVEQKLFCFVNAENLWTKRKSLDPFGYSRPEYYRLLGLISSPSNSLKVEFADHDTVSIKPKWNPKFQWHGLSRSPHPVTAPSPHQYDCRIFPEQNFAYLQFNACFDKAAILDGLRMVKPAVRPMVRSWLAIQFRRKKPAGVLQGIYDPDRPFFKDYLAASIRDINRQGITNLIIDVRRNAGGESALVGQLAYHLTRRDDLRGARGFNYNPKVYAYYDPKAYAEYRSWYVTKFGAEPAPKQLLPMKEEPLFGAVTDRKSPYYVPPDRPVFNGRTIVLANQNTGSAAAGFTHLMQDNQLAAIVGTTTHSNPTGPTGVTLLKLPRSKILVSLPNEYYERAVPANGEILLPDYWVENSVADVRTGRDAAFEKALELFHVNESARSHQGN